LVERLLYTQDVGGSSPSLPTTVACSLRPRFNSAMPQLTRRRYPERPDCWHVYYGDVHVGTIGERAGVPVDVDQWGWACGFYPGLHPGQHRYGTAASFAKARDGFEKDWQRLLPEIPEGAFQEWRHQRDWTARKYAMWERGEKLPSQIPTSMMRCPCGERFDSHKPAESYDHRRHIYAAQAEGFR
jgi:hypothetical protein